MSCAEEPVHTSDSELTVDRAMDDRALELINTGAHEPAELAKTLGVSLRELSIWSQQRSSIRALSGLIRLADVRARILISTYRASAAIRLAQIIASDETSETVRKACLDLLATKLNPVESAADDAPEDQQAPPVDTAAIEQAFRKLADNSRDRNDG